jgi:hypothetical protein
MKNKTHNFITTQRDFDPVDPGTQLETERWDTFNQFPYFFVH